MKNVVKYVNPVHNLTSITTDGYSNKLFVNQIFHLSTMNDKYLTHITRQLKMTSNFLLNMSRASCTLNKNKSSASNK